jgi:hypothetical protein
MIEIGELLPIKATSMEEQHCKKMSQFHKDPWKLSESEASEIAHMDEITMLMKIKRLASAH